MDLQDPVQSLITNATYSRAYIVEEMEAGTLGWLNEEGLVVSQLVPNDAMREAVLYHRQNHHVFSVPVRVQVLE